MLKFTVRRETSSLGLAGDMHSIVVDAGGIPGMISIVEPDPGMPGEPPDPWRGYILRMECCAWAASLLHALELAVREAARWIAVELLKDTAPLDDQPAVVALWLAEWDFTGLQLHVVSPGHTVPCGVMQREHETRWRVQQHRLFETSCASKEQALAVLIEHAAPWIAAALLKREP